MAAYLNLLNLSGENRQFVAIGSYSAILLFSYSVIL